MYRIFLLSLLLVGGTLLPAPAAAQSPSNATAFLQVIEMRIRVAHAPMYAAPRRNAEVVRTLAWNERLLALAQVGAFYRVVHPEGGPQGYILSTQLQSAHHPLQAEAMPEAVRRDLRFVGARFDLLGGVAIPYRSSSFADGYRPGASVGARLSFPLGGPVGLTARMAYRQFGRGRSGALIPPLRAVDVRGRDLSLLAGTLGLDLTLFRGHILAFVAAADGGVYHARVDDAVLPRQNPFREATAWTWGGTVSFQASARLAHGVRLFVEPSYEVIRAEPSWLHMVPARIGLSLER